MLLPFHGLLLCFVDCFVSLAFGDVSCKKLLWPISKRLLPVFSSKIFMVSGLIFRSLNHFKFLFCVWCKKVVQFHSFAVQVFQHHLLKRLPFSHCTLFPAMLKINWPYNCGFISGFSILFCRSMCLPLCQYHTVLITTTLLYILKSGIVIPPVLFFCFKIALAVRGLLWFHTNFRIICSSSVKNAVGILIEIALTL